MPGSDVDQRKIALFTFLTQLIQSQLQRLNKGEVAFSFERDFHSLTVAQLQEILIDPTNPAHVFLRNEENAIVTIDNLCKFLEKVENNCVSLALKFNNPDNPERKNELDSIKCLYLTVVLINHHLAHLYLQQHSQLNTEIVKKIIVSVRKSHELLKSALKGNYGTLVVGGIPNVIAIACRNLNLANQVESLARKQGIDTKVIGLNSANFAADIQLFITDYAAVSKDVAKSSQLYIDLCEELVRCHSYGTIFNILQQFKDKTASLSEDLRIYYSNLVKALLNYVERCQVFLRESSMPSQDTNAYEILKKELAILNSFKLDKNKLIEYSENIRSFFKATNDQRFREIYQYIDEHLDLFSGVLVALRFLALDQNNNFVFNIKVKQSNSVLLYHLMYLLSHNERTIYDQRIAVQIIDSIKITSPGFEGLVDAKALDQDKFAQLLEAYTKFLEEEQEPQNDADRFYLSALRAVVYFYREFSCTKNDEKSLLQSFILLDKAYICIQEAYNCKYFLNLSSDLILLYAEVVAKIHLDFLACRLALKSMDIKDEMFCQIEVQASTRTQWLKEFNQAVSARVDLKHKYLYSFIDSVFTIYAAGFGGSFDNTESLVKILSLYGTDVDYPEKKYQTHCAMYAVLNCDYHLMFLQALYRGSRFNDFHKILVGIHALFKSIKTCGLVWDDSQYVKFVNNVLQIYENYQAVINEFVEQCSAEEAKEFNGHYAFVKSIIADLDTFSARIAELNINEVYSEQAKSIEKYKKIFLELKDKMAAKAKELSIAIEESSKNSKRINLQQKINASSLYRFFIALLNRQSERLEEGEPKILFERDFKDSSLLKNPITGEVFRSEQGIGIDSVWNALEKCLKDVIEYSNQIEEDAKTNQDKHSEQVYCFILTALINHYLCHLYLEGLKPKDGIKPSNFNEIKQILIDKAELVRKVIEPILDKKYGAPDEVICHDLIILWSHHIGLIFSIAEFLQKNDEISTEELSRLDWESQAKRVDRGSSEYHDSFARGKKDNFLMGKYCRQRFCLSAELFNYEGHADAARIIVEMSGNLGAIGRVDGNMAKVYEYFAKLSVAFQKFLMVYYTDLLKQAQNKDLKRDSIKYEDFVKKINYAVSNQILDFKTLPERLESFAKKIAAQHDASILTSSAKNLRENFKTFRSLSSALDLIHYEINQSISKDISRKQNKKQCNAVLLYFLMQLMTRSVRIDYNEKDAKNVQEFIKMTSPEFDASLKINDIASYLSLLENYISYLTSSELNAAENTEIYLILLKAFVYFALGQIYWQQGLLSQAYEAFSNALEYIMDADGHNDFSFLFGRKYSLYTEAFSKLYLAYFICLKELSVKDKDYKVEQKDIAKIRQWFKALQEIRLKSITFDNNELYTAKYSCRLFSAYAVEILGMNGESNDPVIVESEDKAKLICISDVMFYSEVYLQFVQALFDNKKYRDISIYLINFDKLMVAFKKHSVDYEHKNYINLIKVALNINTVFISLYKSKDKISFELFNFINDMLNMLDVYLKYICNEEGVECNKKLKETKFKVYAEEAKTIFQQLKIYDEMKKKFQKGLNFADLDSSGKDKNPKKDKIKAKKLAVAKKPAAESLSAPEPASSANENVRVDQATSKKKKGKSKSISQDTAGASPSLSLRGVIILPVPVIEASSPISLLVQVESVNEVVSDALEPVQAEVQSEVAPVVSELVHVESVNEVVRDVLELVQAEVRSEVVRVVSELAQVELITEVPPVSESVNTAAISESPVLVPGSARAEASHDKSLDPSPVIALASAEEVVLGNEATSIEQPTSVLPTMEMKSVEPIALPGSIPAKKSIDEGVVKSAVAKSDVRPVSTSKLAKGYQGIDELRAKIGEAFKANDVEAVYPEYKKVIQKYAAIEKKLKGSNTDEGKTALVELNQKRIDFFNFIDEKLMLIYQNDEIKKTLPVKYIEANALFLLVAFDSVRCGDAALTNEFDEQIIKSDEDEISSLLGKQIYMTLQDLADIDFIIFKVFKSFDKHSVGSNQNNDVYVDPKAKAEQLKNLLGFHHMILNDLVNILRPINQLMLKALKNVVMCYMDTSYLYALCSGINKSVTEISVIDIIQQTIEKISTSLRAMANYSQNLNGRTDALVWLKKSYYNNSCEVNSAQNLGFKFQPM